MQDRTGHNTNLIEALRYDHFQSSGASTKGGTEANRLRFATTTKFVFQYLY